MSAPQLPPGVDPTAAPVLLPQTYQSLFGLCIAFAVVETIVLGLRFWARAITREKNFGADDWFALAAWPFVIAMNASTSAGMRHGFGIHLAELAVTFPGAITDSLKRLFPGYIVYTVGIAFLRISATLFYRRIFSSPTNTFRYWIYAGVGLNIAWLVACLLVTIFQCIPVQAYWDKTIVGAHCLATLPVQLQSVVGCIILDLVTLVMPLPMIWQLRLDPTKKALITGIFVIGWSVIVVSVGRLVVVVKSGTELNDDFTWFLPQVFVWLNIELLLASVCISLPNLFMLARHARMYGWRSIFGGSRRTYANSYGEHFDKGMSGKQNSKKSGGFGAVGRSFGHSSRASRGFRSVDSSSGLSYVEGGSYTDRAMETQHLPLQVTRKTDFLVEEERNLMV